MQGRTINGRWLLVGDEPRIGGLSEVWRAVDTGSPTGAPVAVKLLKRRNGPLPDIFLEREKRSLELLQHPNIVTLLDTGFWEEKDRFYLVLEWVEHSLKRELAAREPMSWTSFYRRTGAPLLSALAYAHLAGVQHRDLKPANVLVTNDGGVKLADFGIAKLLDNFGSRGDETVADYRSTLYSPPEKLHDVPYVRDVFGFGVLAIQALSGERARDYPDLEPTLDALDLDREIAQILRSCVTFDPKQRPANASVLEEQIRAAEQALDAEHARRSSHLWLQLSRKAAAKVLGLPPEGSDADIDWRRAKSLILEDLGASVYADFGYNEQTKTVDTNCIRLAGRRLFLRLVPDERCNDRNVIVHAEERKPEWHATWRGRNVDVGSSLTFTFDDPGEDAAYHGVGWLVQQLEERVAERRQAEDARLSLQSVGLFDGWSRVLDAREELAAGGKRPLPYTSAFSSSDGQRWVFRLAQPAPTSLLGEEWSIGETAQARPLARGEVVDEDPGGDTVTLVLRRGTRVPDRGCLIPFLGPANAAISRQRDALAALTGARTVNPQLRPFLEDPAAIPPGEPMPVSTWFRRDLDDSKRRVVQHALGTQPLLLVEGPPGTGKTTVIAEIVEQVLKRDPNSRILIVSQTHIAIDNALARIAEAGITDAVRIGRPDDPRVAVGARHLLLDSQLKKWARRVRQRAEAYLDDFASRHGQVPRHLRAALRLEELAAVAADLTHVEGVLERLQGEQQPDHTTSARERGDQILSARLRRDDLLARRREVFEAVQQEVGSDLTLREERAAGEARDVVEALLGSSQTARRLMDVVQLQGEWLSRIDSDQQLIAQFLKSRRIVGGTTLGFLGHPAVRDLEFDVCIVDEASKATATETLVPLARSKRWILVGDPNQLPPLDEDLLRDTRLMNEHHLNPELVQTTLFSHLLRQTTYPVRHRLREQYRMTPPIGDLISHCFYDDDLVSPGKAELAGYTGLNKPVLWLDTSPMGAARRESRALGETSVSNRAEAQVAARRLQLIDRAIEHGIIRPPGEKLEVLVIAPYGRQVEELRRRFAGARPKYLAVEVLSVDAVQGRECDIAVFSVTRSNDRNEIGFLGPAHWRRINVALSRARYGLIIIGDAPFCGGTDGALRQVLAYMGSHRDDCEVLNVNA